MSTTRALHDAVTNVLDFLMVAELATYATQVSLVELGEERTRVSFHSHTAAPFLVTTGHPTVDQFIAWAETGAYSAMLFDGSLLQLTFDLKSDHVVGHRLAYAPCPFDIDEQLLTDGEPLVDVIEAYRDGDALLRTPVRFDFDQNNASEHHPASHMTFNGMDCRIACAAPMHPLRFVDFIFRHFYKSYWDAHAAFFGAAGWRHLGSSTLTDPERAAVHITWDIHAKESTLAG